MYATFGRLLVLGVLSIGPGCDSVEQGADGEQGPPGQPGVDGAPGLDGDDGLSCWDLNANSTCDAGEDVAAPAGCDALDCRGPEGGSGTSGEAGLPGDDGEDGVSCWDLDADGACDPEEDVAAPAGCDVLDCRGADGDDGLPGEPGGAGDDGSDGLACWDLDGDATCDAEEDVVEPAGCDVLDCRGAQGPKGDDGADGDPGLEGQDGDDGYDALIEVADTVECEGKRYTVWRDIDRDGKGGGDDDIQIASHLICDGADGLNGLNGKDGQACWDLDGDWECDEEENIDGSDTCGVEDCRGPQGLQGEKGEPGIDGDDGAPGKDGANGKDGSDGRDGSDGLACWDLNANATCDLATEDANKSGTCTALDCRGADGADGSNGAPGSDGFDGNDGKDGLMCWDLDASGVCEKEKEDIDKSGECDVGDCRGSGSPTTLRYMGLSEGSFPPGHQVPYLGADDLCFAQYPAADAFVCSTSDILAVIRSSAVEPQGLGEGWVNSFLGAPADCGGWTKAEGNGTSLEGGVFTGGVCNRKTMKFHCCATGIDTPK